jgi:hypothetical protein
MGTITNPIDLAKLAAADFAACYGSDLVSVIVYGSAAGQDFAPKRSDINLLVVLSAITLPVLEKSIPVQQKWMKKRFARPLFLDKEYVASSLDSFPIEFFDMKECHSVVFGEDILQNLVIEKSDLRLQIEREVKGKWLHLNRGWLESKGTPARLRLLLSLSIRDFSPIFRAILHVKGLPIPRERAALFADAGTAFGLKGGSLENALAAIRSGGKREMAAAFPPYADAIKSMCNAIDQLSTKGNS